MRPMTIHVMQEHLHELLPLVWIPPVQQIDAPIKHSVARRQQNAAGTGSSLDKNGPGFGGYLADIQCDADLACRPVAMAAELVATLVETEMRVGRVERQPGAGLDVRPHEFKKTFECGVAMRAQAVRDQRIARI